MKYLAIIILFITIQHANAQVRTIVIASKIEAHGKQDKYNIYHSGTDSSDFDLTFDLSGVPANAIIKNVSLQLILNDTYTTVRLAGEVKNESHNMTIRNRSTGNYEAGDEVLLGTTDSKLFADKIITSKASENAITLRIFTQEDDKKYKISNIISDSKTAADPAKTPRLIIDYNPELKPLAWSGMYANAQHSSTGVSVFQDGSMPTGLKVNFLAETGPNKGLILYGDRILLTGGSTALYALDPLTGNKTLLKNELDPPAYSPVVSRDGYYYHASAGKIIRIKLNDATTQNWPISISNAPVLGRDGSIYLTTDTFVRAYTPPPQQKLLWRYDIGYKGGVTVRSSPVSLSNDDSLAYVLYGKNDDTAAQLAAINVANKKVKTYPLNLDLYGNAKMPVIVVGKSDYLYFIDGDFTGKNLYIFDKKLNSQTIISNYKFVSRPVVSNNYVYVLADGNLLQLKGSQVTDKIEVHASKADKIIADNDDNIYLLSGTLVTMCSFKKGQNRNVVTLDIHKQFVYNDMIVAPDGSIYLTSDNYMYAIRPETFTPEYFAIPGLSFINNTTYRSNNLEIGHKRIEQDDVLPTLIHQSKGNILIGNNGILIWPYVIFESGTDNTLESGGSISIQRGFKVEKGAVLSIKTGY